MVRITIVVVIVSWSRRKTRIVVTHCSVEQLLRADHSQIVFALIWIILLVSNRSLATVLLLIVVLLMLVVRNTVESSTTASSTSSATSCVGKKVLASGVEDAVL